MTLLTTTIVPVAGWRSRYAFRTPLDTSPLEHLNVLRLNAIRQAIRRSDPSVRSIAELAVLHGEKHLGRFAAGYGGIFGGLPGETWRARTAPRGR
ncbi:MAG: helix-turn-helix domain-containing protein [Verrucomicrobia bacterium]|nr:helix-turn-helix domain-containing protein [Verrucomicrobiota bacterium]